MALKLSIHPDNPQPRLIRQASDQLHRGAVLAVPTDSSYALVCQIDDKAAADALRHIRQLDDKRLLSMLCRDLSELASYAHVDNAQFRLIKNATPGPYTFILQASREVPRRLSHPKRKTIGLRVPGHKITQALLADYGAPLLATTLTLPGDEQALNDADEIQERLDKQIALVIDGGACAAQPTTVIDFSGTTPELIRAGLGDIAVLGF